MNYKYAVFARVYGHIQCNLSFSVYYFLGQYLSIIGKTRRDDQGVWTLTPKRGLVWLSHHFPVQRILEVSLALLLELPLMEDAVLAQDLLLLANLHELHSHPLLLLGLPHQPLHQLLLPQRLLQEVTAPVTVTLFPHVNACIFGFYYIG